MVVIVEGVKIGCRCWNIRTSPPVGGRSIKTLLNGRKQSGCVTFVALTTLHFNTSKDKKEEEQRHA